VAVRLFFGHDGDLSFDGTDRTHTSREKACNDTYNDMSSTQRKILLMLDTAPLLGSRKGYAKQEERALHIRPA